LTQLFVGRIVADVTHSQRVDREQVEADYWFGKLRGRLLLEILWADDQVAAVPYFLTAKARLDVLGHQLVMASIDDDLELAGV
jgi:hypothetical protein